MAISEANIGDGANFKISGYSFITSKRLSGGSRSLLGIRKDLTYAEYDVTPHDTNEYVCAIVKSKSRHFTVISTYIQTATPFDSQRLEHIVQNTPSPHILCGDFNAHHEVWGSTHNDKRGRQINDVAERLNLVLLNDGTPTFYRGETVSSVLDLTFVSADYAKNVTWSTDLEARGSDHIPVLIFVRGFDSNKKSRSVLVTD